MILNRGRILLGSGTIQPIRGPKSQHATARSSAAHATTKSGPIANAIRV